MNWTRLILDALVMAAVFNLAAMAAMAYDPRLILPGYPKSIREIAPPAARNGWATATGIAASSGSTSSGDYTGRHGNRMKTG